MRLSFPGLGPGRVSAVIRPPMTSFSQCNSRLTLEGLREDKENTYFERKGRGTKHTKIATEIIGMLNAGGGVIVYGMTDEGTVEDLSIVPARKLNDYRRIAHDLIEPPAKVELEEIVLETGELIFLYHIEHDYERLFKRRDNEEVYLRVADSNKGPLNRDEVKKLEYNKPIRSFEDEPREDFSVRDLNPAACAAYVKAMNFNGSFEELARRRSLAVQKEGRLVYKNAAVLLFAEDPSQYIPNALVRYVRYSGTVSRSGEDYNVVKDERFEGCLYALIPKIEIFIGASLRDYYYLDLDVGRFERIQEFPKDAWLEGVVNALCHRSYNIQGNSIYIRHYDDRLVISNSGPLPAQVTVENIQTERYSRNPRMARVLSELGFVRELNEGVPRIFNAMRRSMLAKPEYSNEADTVSLTLRNKVSNRRDTILSEVQTRIEANWNDLNETQRQIVLFILMECEATVDALVEQVGLSVQAVRYNLKHLEELKIIKRCSEKIRDRAAPYRFCEE